MGTSILEDGSTVTAAGASLVFSSVQGSHTIAPVFMISGLHTFPAGLAMISVPTDYSSQSLANVLGYAAPILARWDPVQDQYDVTPVPPANSLAVGNGYWVRFPQPSTILAPGLSPPTAAAFTWTLSKGWNMIGSPRLSSVVISSLTVEDSSSFSYTIVAASSTGLVGDAL